MGSHELAPELQLRLRDTLGSFEELHLLLYALRQRKPWPAAEAARELHLEEAAMDEAVDRLMRAGLLARAGPTGPQGRCFTYHPASPALAELAERLAEAVDRDPLHVFDLMNRHAVERLRTSAARAFASAFVLGSEKDG